MLKRMCNFSLALMVMFAVLAPAGAVTVAPSLESKYGMVAAANPLAARAGAEILEKGGNAVDAAIAVSFALGVAEPYASGIGGEGYAVIAMADGKKYAIDFRSAAPAMATYENLAKTGKPIKKIKYGPKGFCISGVLAGAAKAHALGGTLPLSELIAPAVRLAEEGFEVNETFAKVVTSKFDVLLKNSPDFLNADLPWEKGDLFKNPALARTLRIISEKGPDAFYRGELGDNLDAFMTKNGGWARKSDLEAYRAIERTPLHGTYNGYDLYVPGAPVGGGRILASLNILENFNLGAMGWDDPLAVHLMQEAFILTALDQRKFVGDPAFFDTSEQGFISKQYARSRMMQIALDSASDPAGWKARLGNPGAFEKGESYVDVMIAAAAAAAAAKKLAPEPKPESPSTTHISVIDKDGNAVSWTQTISSFFGTGCWVDGYFLNNELGNFKEKPVEGDPSNLEPGKRPRTTIVPSIVEKDGKVRWIIGSPGGGRIGSTVAEILICLIDHGMTIEDAVKTPKFAGYDSYKEIRMEKGYSPSTISFLQQVLGHKVKMYEYPDLFFGGPNIVAVKADGTYIGMGSIRRNGAAAAPELQ